MGLASEHVGGGRWQDETNLTDGWDLQVSTSVVADGKMNPMDITYKRIQRIHRIHRWWRMAR
jgi:hypothetical protein